MRACVHCQYNAGARVRGYWPHVLPRAAQKAAFFALFPRRGLIYRPPRRLVVQTALPQCGGRFSSKKKNRKRISKKKISNLRIKTGARIALCNKENCVQIRAILQNALFKKTKKIDKRYYCIAHLSQVSRRNESEIEVAVSNEKSIILFER